MKRTLNWYAMTSAYKVLVGDADRTTKIGALRKFLEEGESVDGLLKIMGAIHALAPTTPAILTDEFKTQINKAAWTAYCMKKGYCDFSGRVAKTFKYVRLETGAVCRKVAGTAVEAPSLQTWLPFTENAMAAYCQFSNELEQPHMVSDHTLDTFNSLYLLDPSRPGEVISRHEGKARELGMGYGAVFMHEANKKGQQDYMDAQALRKHWDSDLKNQKRETTMNLTQKANAFFGNLKAIGGDLLRVQRGRATLHSAKRVIFSALPFKWGFLARITGKAKKVENHPFTDLALAFALHGATSFAITDAAKREKYLKYTEEMLVAAGYSASLKMLPIEDMLDKVFAGVSESEAMTKLKEMVKELPEETGIAAHKPE